MRRETTGFVLRTICMITAGGAIACWIFDPANARPVLLAILLLQCMVIDLLYDLRQRR